MSWLKDILELAGKQNVFAARMSQLDCTIAADLRAERVFTRYEPAVRLCDASNILPLRRALNFVKLMIGWFAVSSARNRAAERLVS
jgi:hypothetical protein